MSNLYKHLEEELETLKRECTALTLEAYLEEPRSATVQRNQLSGRIAGIKYVLGVIETTYPAMIEEEEEK